MEAHQFLDIYDNLRRQIVLYGFDREEAKSVVHHLSPSGDGMIVFSNLTEGTTDSAIRAQAEDFQRRGGSLEWMVYAYEQPADLGERLV